MSKNSRKKDIKNIKTLNNNVMGDNKKYFLKYDFVLFLHFVCFQLTCLQKFIKNRLTFHILSNFRNLSVTLMLLSYKFYNLLALIIIRP